MQKGSVLGAYHKRYALLNEGTPSSVASPEDRGADRELTMRL